MSFCKHSFRTCIILHLAVFLACWSYHWDNLQGLLQPVSVANIQNKTCSHKEGNVCISKYTLTAIALIYCWIHYKNECPYLHCLPVLFISSISGTDPILIHVCEQQTTSHWFGPLSDVILNWVYSISDICSFDISVWFILSLKSSPGAQVR